ncbi:MAG TPA: hypothetical protein VFI76_07650, partial [Terrimicrobiaceae bacterium]|nr:hypothetical protein [Terrimicrobiaceae bacterium]
GRSSRMVVRLGRPWTRWTIFSGSKPRSRAHWDQTRVTTGVESTKTPSISNNSALQEIFGIRYENQKSDPLRSVLPQFRKKLSPFDKMLLK